MSIKPRRTWVIPIDDESSAELREGVGELDLQLDLPDGITDFRAADLRRGEPVQYGPTGIYKVTELREVKPGEYGYSDGYRIKGRVWNPTTGMWREGRWLDDGRYAQNSLADGLLNLYPLETDTVLNAGQGGVDAKAEGD